MEGIAIYQAPQALNLVLFSPIWLGLLILSSVIRRNCSASFLLTHATRPFLRLFVYSTKNVFRSRLIFPNDESHSKDNPASQHNFISDQVNKFFQRFCRHLPISGELQICGRRTQSRYFFRNGYYFTKFHHDSEQLFITRTLEWHRHFYNILFFARSLVVVPDPLSRATLFSLGPMG